MNLPYWVPEWQHAASRQDTISETRHMGSVSIAVGDHAGIQTDLLLHQPDNETIRDYEHHRHPSKPNQKLPFIFTGEKMEPSGPEGTPNPIPSD